MKKRIHKVLVEPIKEVSSPIVEIEQTGQLSGFLLLNALFLTLLFANIPLSGTAYIQFWSSPLIPELGGISSLDIINKGLMTLFMLEIGLDLKKEFVYGELQTYRRANLPLIAAIGGLIVPIVIFCFFNQKQSNYAGWIIPTTTDIAFSLGILKLLGNKVPNFIKVFFIALVIIDDLLAISLLVVFYLPTVASLKIVLTLLSVLTLFGLRYFKPTHIIPYFLIGVFVWWNMVQAGLPPALSGIFTALSIPINRIEELKRWLYMPVNYLIVPLFVFANVAVIINVESLEFLQESHVTGVLIGLLLGKPVGIMIATWLAVRLNIAQLPPNINWIHILGMGILAGTGVTMAIFMTEHSYLHSQVKDFIKIGVIIASLTSGILSTLIFIKTSSITNLFHWSLPRFFTKNVRS
ncbi:Na+/H+ antiporter NhaA [Flectobacillus longus]|uniref:Na+/H+ antiporter NhaA n=1 Tax=Flectobacillus longus TaxID=2984207 RepID=UPI0024B6AB08|nr:Na+/H+ antiporter NhaA [Flectobacillus longus]MDI9882552.1 Na+/H+ antiporter NhaA [Flectobacillus longus]